MVCKYLETEERDVQHERLKDKEKRKGGIYWK
jgi:hypothetical protein